MAMTVAQALAAEAAKLTFRDLPRDVIHEVKRSMLDTLACGFGGYGTEPARIVQSAIEEMHGPAEATVLGNGLKTSCLNATLVNGVMVRYYDYGSICYPTKEALISAGHHSECIPPVIALGERQHSSGQDVITAIVLAYELMNKVFDSIPDYNSVLDKSGFVHETMRCACVMALAAGKLLGLSEGQMAHALVVAGGFNLELGVLYTDEEEVTMTRNLRFPHAAYNGILAATLARKGFQGPLNAFEGHNGFAQVVGGGKMDLEKLKQPRREWTIQHTWIKKFAAGGAMQGLLEATLELVKQHDIKAEDVAEIRIKTTAQSCRVLGNAQTRRYPKTTFSADHSAYYCTAWAILDQAVGPMQFSEEKLGDPRWRELAAKITIEPELSSRYDRLSSPGHVEITTTKGQKYQHEVLLPKGHPMNPMTDTDVEEKFRAMAGRFYSEKETVHMIDTIYNMEKLKDIGELAKLLVFPQGSNRSFG